MYGQQNIKNNFLYLLAQNATMIIHVRLCRIQPRNLFLIKVQQMQHTWSHYQKNVIFWLD